MYLPAGIAAGRVVLKRESLAAAGDIKVRGGVVLVLLQIITD